MKAGKRNERKGREMEGREEEWKVGKRNGRQGRGLEGRVEKELE